jgi:putative transcriptional regulator
MRKSIQAAILDTAHGLHRAGVMGEVTLRDLKALSLPPVKPLTPTQIRKIRRAHHLSQAVFARVLNTSVSTIQKWETGDKVPGGPSLKLLHVVKSKGLQAVA